MLFITRGLDEIRTDVILAALICKVSRVGRRRIIFQISGMPLLSLQSLAAHATVDIIDAPSTAFHAHRRQMINESQRTIVRWYITDI